MGGGYVKKSYICPMEYKRIIGKTDLFIGDDGWMYTTDSWGKYEKLKRTVRGKPGSKHYYAYFEGTDYKICNIVYTYFVANIEGDKQVGYIKGKNPKLDNLILLDRNFDKIKDVTGKKLKSGWSVEKVLRASPSKKVLAVCPCGEHSTQTLTRNEGISVEDFYTEIEPYTKPVTLKEFIERFVCKNTLFRLWYKCEKGEGCTHRPVLEVDKDILSMEWELLKGEGDYRYFGDNEVVGV